MGFKSILKAAAPFAGPIAGIAGAILSNKETGQSTARSIAFQREIAQNAHQWEVEDLKKAGLNPILSAGGPGARASGGAQYQARNIFENAAATALAIKRQTEEIKLIKAQTIKTGHEGQINAVGATAAGKLLEALGAPVGSALDAMGSGYLSIQKLFERAPSSAKDAQIIFKEKFREAAEAAKKAGRGSRRELKIRIRKNAEDYK